MGMNALPSLPRSLPPAPDEVRERYFRVEAERELMACIRGEPYEYRPFDSLDPRGRSVSRVRK